MPKTTTPKKVNPILACPVCLSDNLDVISLRMKKCLSCGFIWNHEVSDRDNILLIVEHQTKMEDSPDAPPLKIVKSAKKASRKKSR